MLRGKIKKITNIYNPEDEGRKASKLISSVFNSGTLLCLSVSLCLASLSYGLFTAVRIPLLRTALGRRLFWTGFITVIPMLLQVRGSKLRKNTRRVSCWGKLLWMAAWRVCCAVSEEKTNWNIFTQCRTYIFQVPVWWDCVIVSNSKDGLDLLPSPRPLLSASCRPHLSSNPSLMLWSSVLEAPEQSWHLT